MTMTRRQAAQRLLDSFDSQKRMHSRLVFAIIQAIIISILIGFFSSWHFGLATLLIVGLLLQFAFDRMNNSIIASKLTAIKALKWDEDSLEKENLRAVLNSIIDKGGGHEK
jgi:c-di-AMP phosphodiesterase-like protein